MNIYCVVMVLYYSMTKVCIGTGVEVMDLCFIRTAMLFCVAVFQLKLSQKSIIKDVPQEKWVLLISRCLVGLIGFTSMITAIKLLQVSVVTVVRNTSPFWTAIISYFVAN